MHMLFSSTFARACFVALLVLLAPLVGGRAAVAAELAITGGSLDAKGNTGMGPLVLEGDRGFTFHGLTYFGNYQPGLCNGSVCRAGDRISLLASWSGSDLLGVATLDGITYPHVSDNFDISVTNASLAVAFYGSFLLPRGSSPVMLVAPFLFNGTFHHLGGPDMLVGSGVATIELYPIVGYPEERWGVKRVTYQLGGRLPAPWATEDVGASQTPGRTSVVNDAIVVEGDGADIWGQADSFRLTFQELAGGGSVSARVVTQEQTYSATSGAVPLNRFAKAGVMIRASTAPNAASVILDVKPDGEIEFMARYVTNAPTVYLGGPVTGGRNVWLALSRRPTGEIDASYSTDGWVWTLLGTVSLDVADGALLAGLALTSHDAGVLNGAIFDHVTISRASVLDLLVRGGFEGYEPPALGAPGWISDDGLRQVPAKSETYQPRSGANNGACWTTGYLDCGMYQEVIAPRAGLYAFSIYATADRAGGLIGVNVNGANANSASVEPRGFRGYTRYTLTFTASAGDTIRVWMYSPAWPGYVVVDDATLTPQP
jgi:hypothetical protein